MKISSLEARLKLINPYLRVRKKGRADIFPDKTVSAPAGVFLGNDSSATRFDLGHLELRDQPFEYTHRYNPMDKQWHRFVKKRKRRGRLELIRFLQGRRLIKHRWEKQLLSL